jgi:hypothetical protein
MYRKSLDRGEVVDVARPEMTFQKSCHAPKKALP